jgi:hypothetical protein
MSHLTIVRCDNCGATKGPSNNWWQVLESGINVASGCGYYFAVAASEFFNPESFPKPRLRLTDYCGETCLQTAIDRCKSVIRESQFAAKKAAANPTLLSTEEAERSDCTTQASVSQAGEGRAVYKVVTVGEEVEDDVAF